ncbi:MAG: transcription antitermination factor NusB [Nocardioides sp.]
MAAGPTAEGPEGGSERPAGFRGTRSKARKAALDVLFAAEAQGSSPIALLEEQLQERAKDHDKTVRDYTVQIVRGVVAHAAEIDELVSSYSRDWPLERMPAVDRNVLRLATWELLHSDVPAGVVLSEAVSLASALSTDDSPVFVNGVLGAIDREVPRVAQD